MKLRPLFFLMVTLLAAPLFGQGKVLLDPCRYPRLIPMEKSHYLAEILEDPKVSPYLKKCTLERITELYSTAGDKAENGDKILSAIATVTKEKDKETANDEMLRQTACGALGAFEHTKWKGQAVSTLQEIIKKEKKDEVVLACINVLANYSSEKQGIADLLVNLVNTGLEKESLTIEDIRRMNLLVTSLGRLGQQNAYTPLIKVLQSGYPDNVKKAAKRALQDLQLAAEEADN